MADETGTDPMRSPPADQHGLPAKTRVRPKGFVVEHDETHTPRRAPVARRADVLQEFLETRDGVCRFRPCGESSLVDAVDLINCAIASCRNRTIAKLLVNITALAGVSIPSIVDRFLMMEEWAQEGKGMVLVALVVQPEFVHPQKFGVEVAEHFGLTAQVFTSDTEALDWLSSGV
ncbi:MAG: hypothetical protein ABWY07_03930 [Burkholderiales bacterium]